MHQVIGVLLQIAVKSFSTLFIFLKLLLIFLFFQPHLLFCAFYSAAAYCLVSGIIMRGMISFMLLKTIMKLQISLFPH